MTEGQQFSLSSGGPMRRSLIFVLSLSLSLAAFASEKKQIQSLNQALQAIQDLRQTLTAEEILVVFDIDNTLLTTETDLGGDAWFSWQEGLLKSAQPQNLVAKDFDGLLRTQGYLFSLGRMTTPEQMTASVVKSLQDQNHPLFLLTSRGSDFENFTQRELARNNLNPARTAPGPQGGYASRILPYDINHPEADCLSSTELAQWGLQSAKPAVYEEGVYYTGGQHKGAMLRSLLCKTKLNPKAIVFVDDTEKHVDRVLKAYEEIPEVNVISMRYGAMDSQVQRFQASDKSHVIEAWQKLKKILEEVFGREF